MLKRISLKSNKIKEKSDIEWKERLPEETRSALDGCYLLRTEREDLSDQEIWGT